MRGLGEFSVPGRSTSTRSRGLPRDLAVTALILDVAALMWFGWGQAQPPAGWSAWLAAGSTVGLVVAVAASLLTLRLRASALTMHDPQVRRGYARVVVVEVLAIAAGAVGLAAGGRSSYVAAWILLVVGVHLLPLARLFAAPGLGLAGLALTAVAIGAAVAGAASRIQPSAIAGAGGGLICLTCAAGYLGKGYLATRSARRASAPTAGA